MAAFDFYDMVHDSPLTNIVMAEDPKGAQGTGMVVGTDTAGDIMGIVTGMGSVSMGVGLRSALKTRASIQSNNGKRGILKRFRGADKDRKAVVIGQAVDVASGRVVPSQGRDHMAWKRATLEQQKKSRKAHKAVLRAQEAAWTSEGDDEAMSGVSPDEDVRHMQQEQEQCDLEQRLAAANANKQQLRSQAGCPSKAKADRAVYAAHVNACEASGQVVYNMQPEDTSEPIDICAPEPQPEQDDVLMEDAPMVDFNNTYDPMDLDMTGPEPIIKVTTGSVYKKTASDLPINPFTGVVGQWFIVMSDPNDNFSAGPMDLDEDPTKPRGQSDRRQNQPPRGPRAKRARDSTDGRQPRAAHNILGGYTISSDNKPSARGNSQAKGQHGNVNNRQRRGPPSEATPKGKKGANCGRKQRQEKSDSHAPAHSNGQRRQKGHGQRQRRQD